MGGYEVQLPQLGQFISDLTTAAERITDANKQLRDTQPSALGSADIENAGKAFQERWEYGTGKLAEVTDKVTEALRASKDHYAKLEDQVAEMFSGGDAGGSEPTPQNSGIMSALGGDQ